MMILSSRCAWIVALGVALFWPSLAGVQTDAGEIKSGSTFHLGNRTVTVRNLENLPCPEDEYTARFRFDSFANPKLKELRARYQLDEVVAAGRDEFDRQVLLMDWTHRQFRKFGQPSDPAKGALSILQAIGEGHTFFCSQYAQVLVSCAASLGWVDRPLALRRHQGVAQVGGSTEHSVTEIWSNQHRKWVMLDPTSNLFLEREGVPLNAYEIRQEWFYRGGTNLVFVVGKERRRYRRSDLPIILKHFPGFGELAIHPDELDKYGFIGFIPNTDLMDSGFEYGKMFIVKDQLCAGTAWHTRTVPKEPAVEPYFPMGQASLTLAAKNGKLWVELRTFTPNMQRYEIRSDGGGWNATTRELDWEVHLGSNRLEARTVNQFGIVGPSSWVEVEVTE